MSYRATEKQVAATRRSAERWYKIEQARQERIAKEQEAAARGEITPYENKLNVQARSARRIGEIVTRRNRERARDGARFIDESPGADFLRRALGGDAAADWD